jgi:serine/threonine protein kinase
MLRDIVSKPIPMKAYFTEDASSLLKLLLQRDVTKRIGYSEKDAEELKAHPFFKDIDWKAVSE